MWPRCCQNFMYYINTAPEQHPHTGCSFYHHQETHLPIRYFGHDLVLEIHFITMKILPQKNHSPFQFSIVCTLPIRISFFTQASATRSNLIHPLIDFHNLSFCWYLDNRWQKKQRIEQSVTSRSFTTVLIIES